MPSLTVFFLSGRAGRSPTLHEVKHNGLYLRPVRRFPADSLAHPRATCGHCLPMLAAPRFLLPPLPFLFLVLELFGTLALHKLKMQRSDFRQKQKFPIADHDSLHFLQLRFQRLFFLMALFPVGRVFRFKACLFFAQRVHFPFQHFLLCLDKMLDGQRLFQLLNNKGGFFQHGRIIEK